MRERLRRPRHACALLVALAFLLAAAGCVDGEADGPDGGAADLPGALPGDVAFLEAPSGAPPAPDFSADLVDGTPVTASELWDDRPLVLVFTASWCERCADVHRRMADVAAQHEGVAVLGVVPPDDAEGARDYAGELQLGHPVAVADDGVWLDYAVREPPAVVLVAPEGKVLRGWPGGVEPSVLAGHLDDLVREPGSQDG